MSKGIHLLFVPISLFSLLTFEILDARVHARGTTGADVYCFMRNGGNSHEPSWEAAYQSIKNKKQGFFKTSPKQAASMIVEEVVQDPEKYDDCITFLGDLFSESQINSIQKDTRNLEKGNPDSNSSLNSEDSNPKPGKGAYVDRYSY